MQITPNFQKYSRKVKMFATKQSNFHNKNAKLPTLR